MNTLKTMVLNWFGKYGLWALGFVYGLWLILIGIFIGAMLGISAILG